MSLTYSLDDLNKPMTQHELKWLVHEWLKIRPYKYRRFNNLFNNAISGMGRYTDAEVCDDE
jgi:hypothetical protein